MRRAAVALVFATVTLAATSAFARPGGSVTSGYHGSTYRPSIYRHRSSSSGSSDVDAGTVIAVLLGLGICVAVIVILARRAESRTLMPAAPMPNGLPWNTLRAADPAFSQVAFERTVRELYKTVHAPGGLAKVGDRIAEAARAELARSSPAERIQIDSVRAIAVDATSITCAIVANHIDAATTHVTSRWTLSRTPAGWKLDTVVQLAAGSMNLVGMGPEVGNDLPTIEAPGAIAAFLELRDAAGRLLGWDAFIEHVKATYARVTDAWNRQTPDAVADVATPDLVEYLALWIDEHRRQGLVNHHDGATVRHVGLARVVHETNHDLVVVRVYAEGLDYTTTAGTDRVVGGSKTVPRQYTEYWTFVREGTGNFKLASIVQDEMYAG